MLFFPLVNSLRVGINLQVTSYHTSGYISLPVLLRDPVGLGSRVVIWRRSEECVGSVQNLAKNEVSRTVNHLKVKIIFRTTWQPSVLFTVACCQVEFDFFFFKLSVKLHLLL